MKEMTVIPAIMPSVNWAGISIFCRDVGITDPTKLLDGDKIKHNDPAALIRGLGCPEHCMLGFFLYYPNCPASIVITLISEYDIRIKHFATTTNDLVFLMLGNFREWQEAIVQGCSRNRTYEERQVFNKVFDIMRTTNLKRYLTKYTTQVLGDGSFVLCT